MVQAVSEKIIAYAVSSGYVRQEQREEYIYGLVLIINIFITDISMLLIGLAMNMVLECIGFWFFYKLLRKFCGGYHFSTSLRCYLSSVFMCPVVLLCIRYQPYTLLLQHIAVFVSYLILLILSPVPALNKPLDDKEVIIFGRAARIIVSAVSVIYAVCAVFEMRILSGIIMISMISVTIFVIAGKIHFLILKK